MIDSIFRSHSTHLVLDRPQAQAGQRILRDSAGVSICFLDGESLEAPGEGFFTGAELALLDLPALLFLLEEGVVLLRNAGRVVLVTGTDAALVFLTPLLVVLVVAVDNVEEFLQLLPLALPGG